MARFDVYEIKRTISRYVVDVQADLLVSLGTRVVVPLLPPSLMAAPIRDLNPAVTIGTETFLFHLSLSSPYQGKRYAGTSPNSPSSTTTSPALWTFSSQASDSAQKFA